EQLFQMALEALDATSFGLHHPLFKRSLQIVPRPLVELGRPSLVPGEQLLEVPFEPLDVTFAGLHHPLVKSYLKILPPHLVELGHPRVVTGEQLFQLRAAFVESPEQVVLSLREGATLIRKRRSNLLQRSFKQR